MIDSKTMARMSASGMKLLTQRVVTAWWRPPEVHLGDNKYTEKADMWSIGAVFGEMLTGVCFAVYYCFWMHGEIIPVWLRGQRSGWPCCGTYVCFVSLPA